MMGNSDFTYEQSVDLYTEYSNKKVKEAKKTVSRFFFGIMLFLLSAYLIVILVPVFISKIFGEQTVVNLYDSIYYNWIMGLAPMYLIGLPLMFLLVKGMKTQPRQKRKITPLGFLKFFVMAYAFMYIGSYIGYCVNLIIGEITGAIPEQSTSDLIERSPIWLVIITAVIIGPIVEEFIFRKLMIDRLSRFGEGLAIFTSSVAFGLFHGNLYQFFYATAIGFLLGYIYAKTGNIVYPIVMHAMLNFFGSIANMPIAKYAEKLLEFDEAIENGESVNMGEYLKATMAVTSSQIFQYAMIFAGIVLIVTYFIKKLFKMSYACEFLIPGEKRASVIIGNPGAIVFLVFSIVRITLEIITPLLYGGAV